MHTRTQARRHAHRHAQRERERERESSYHTHTHTHTHRQSKPITKPTNKDLVDIWPSEVGHFSHFNRSFAESNYHLNTLVTRNKALQQHLRRQTDPDGSGEGTSLRRQVLCR